jgi:hypothetical protein
VTQAAADSLRAAIREVFSRSVYDWRERRTPFDALRRWWDALLDWLGTLESAHPGILRWLIWALVVVLAAIAGHAVWLLVRTTRRPDPGSVTDPLPGPVARRDARWFRREAERLARAGSFTAALQADFLALVLELDAGNLLRFHPSKTPREYVPELAAPGERRAEFSLLVTDLYRYAFAGDRCGPDDYAGWRARAEPGRYAPSH